MVVCLERGMQLGEVLRRTSERLLTHFPHVEGEILRPASPADVAAHQEMDCLATRILTRAEEIIIAGRMAVAPLDVEVQLDGEHASLFYLRWQGGDVREVVRPLSGEFELLLDAVDLTAETEAESGCGSCGSGGCGGCGTGGCGSGSCGTVSPEEVRAYFAELRQKMQDRRTPLL